MAGGLKNTAGWTADRWEKSAQIILRCVLLRARREESLRWRIPVSRVPSVGIHLVGTAKMKQLNAKWRGKNHSTDVLSFEAPPLFRAQGVLGELVICLPVMKRQARELGLDPLDELRVLLTHGVLHLLGLDHEKGPRAEREMRGWEARLLPARLTNSGLIKRVRSGNS